MQRVLLLIFLCFPVTLFAQNPATITGRVMLLPTQEPLASATISFYRIQKEKLIPTTITLAKTVSSNERGDYEVGLDSASYLVKAELPGFKTRYAWDFYIAKGQQKFLDFNLELIEIGDYEPGTGPSCDIIGSIESPSKEPISNATVTAQDLDNYGQIYQARSDLTGKFVLEAGTCGRVIVYAQKPGYGIGTPVIIALPWRDKMEAFKRQLKTVLVPLK
jgi:hypothetical protein